MLVRMVQASPRMLAHAASWFGARAEMKTVATKVRRRWMMQIPTTVKAVRKDAGGGWEDEVVLVLDVFVVGRAVPGRGVKIRKSSVLLRQSVLMFAQDYACPAYMTKKHAHCAPTCAIPSSPAVQANDPILLQHAMSSRLVGNVRMLAIAHVPDVVPSSTKYGEMPSEDRL